MLTLNILVKKINKNYLIIYIFTVIFHLIIKMFLFKLKKKNIGTILLLFLLTNLPESAELNPHTSPSNLLSLILTRVQLFHGIIISQIFMD